MGPPVAPDTVDEGAGTANNPRTRGSSDAGSLQPQWTVLYTVGEA